MSGACTMEIPNFAPDAGVDATEPDASEATQLVVSFEASPDIPFTDDGVYAPRVDGVHIVLEDVRAIGDAGATAALAMTLDWNDVLVPSPYVVRGAAPGLYSQLRASVVSYEIYGSVLVGGQRVDFEINDKPDAPLGLEMPLVNCLVEAGQQKQTPVRFRGDDVVDDIAWDQLAPDADGVVRIDGADSAVLDQVRKQLEESFEYEEDGAD